jgi:transcriptional regulator with XRE-family HTH domain
MARTKGTGKGLPKAKAPKRAKGKVAHVPKLSLKSNQRWSQIVTRIKGFMHHHNYTQGDFARLAEMHRPFLSRILNTPTNLTLETIMQLEKALKDDLIIIPSGQKQEESPKQETLDIKIPMQSDTVFQIPEQK